MYLSIKQDYPDSEIARQALLQALRNLFRLEYKNIPDSDWTKIRDQIRIKPGKSVDQEYLDLMDVLYQWKAGRYQDAMSLAEKILLKNPDSSVVSQMLSLKRPRLTYTDWQSLANLVKKSRSLQYLDISGMGIQSLKPLQGASLYGLDCSYNNLKDLNGLEEMELHSLNLRGNPLTFNTSGNTADWLNRIRYLQISGKRP